MHKRELLDILQSLGLDKGLDKRHLLKGGKDVILWVKPYSNVNDLNKILHVINEVGYLKHEVRNIFEQYLTSPAFEEEKSLLYFLLNSVKKSAIKWLFRYASDDLSIKVNMNWLMRGIDDDKKEKEMILLWEAMREFALLLDVYIVEDEEKGTLKPSSKRFFEEYKEFLVEYVFTIHYLEELILECRELQYLYNQDFL